MLGGKHFEIAIHNDLNPGDVIELRYQHKKSPGQTASRMGISRDEMTALEQSGLEKLRNGLENWHQDS